MDTAYMRLGTVWLLWIMLLRSTAGQRTDCPMRHEMIGPNRICQRSCVTDINCLSRKKLCLCDQDCGMSCIKKKHRCLPLSDIPNGRVIHPREMGFGSSSKYECNEGYKLKGTIVRGCQGDESWSGSEPRCIADRTQEKRKECQPPPIVKFAIHDGAPDQASFPMSTMLKYKCLVGYTMQDDAVPRAWCVDKGQWVGPNVTCSHAGCPRLEDIDDGYVEQAAAVEIGGTAVYKCLPGYFLAGREVRECGPNGRWEGVEPSCETVTCGKPPNVDNGIHNGNIDQQRYPSGAQLQYTCDHGYHRDGAPRAMCMDGEWEGLTLICKPRNCGFPGDTVNGWRSGYVFIFPHRVTYDCNQGYEMIGAGYRMCQANGEWSNEVPMCKPVTCPTLFSPVFGRMIGSGTGYGTKIRFECNKNFKVVGSVERTCQEDRTWSGTNAKCEEIDCGWPGPFYNGYLIGTSTTVGSTLYFSCATRTTYQGDEYQTVCKEDGTWSMSPPTCLGQCLVPTLNNATLLKGHSGEYVNHGAEVEFRCNNGLVPRDSGAMKCLNGTWTAAAECIPAPCPRNPPHVRNGMRVYMGVHHMAKAKYRCFPGFRLNTSKMNTTYLTCTFGTWVGGVPQCEEFYCKTPGPLPNGLVYKKLDDVRFLFKPYIRTIEHGTRLEFKCNDGYRLVGPSGATCVNGEWRPAMDRPGTKCETAVHPPFRRLWTPIPNDSSRK